MKPASPPPFPVGTIVRRRCHKRTLPYQVVATAANYPAFYISPLWIKPPRHRRVLVVGASDVERVPSRDEQLAVKYADLLSAMREVGSFDFKILAAYMNRPFNPGLCKQIQIAKRLFLERKFPPAT